MSHDNFRSCHAIEENAGPNIDLSAPRETKWLRYVPTYRRAHKKLGRYLYRIGFTSTTTYDDDLCSITDEMKLDLQPINIQYINIEFNISIMLHKT